MPVSPAADAPASKEITQNEEEAPINVEELAEELKDGDESDPTVSTSSQRFRSIHIQPAKGGPVQLLSAFDSLQARETSMSKSMLSFRDVCDDIHFIGCVLGHHGESGGMQR